MAELGIAMTVIAALIAGCSGGGSSSSSPSNSLSGIVADGYISGATACLDLNNNGVCDSGEPTGTTNASGAFTITGTFTAAQAASAPLVVQIPATAVDSDFPASTVGQAFTLTSPAGASFVSPLTTLVQLKVAAGDTQAAADAAVLKLLGIGASSGVSALDNYMTKATSGANQTDLYVRSHAAAQVVAAVFKQGKVNLGSAGTTTDVATQNVLADQAQAVLALQGTGITVASGVAFTATTVTASTVAPASTLRANIAGANVPAATAATQAVTLNFDLINGTTAVGTTGCLTPITVGTGSTAGTLAAAKFYVSRVALIDSNGGYSPLRLTENSMQSRGVALLNFEDGTGTCAAASTSFPTYTSVVGTVVPAPSGTTYVGVAFTVGVPQYSTDGGPRALLNHSDPAATTTPPPLQNVGNAWSWQSGRKFSRIELLPTVTGAANANLTMVHLGSTGCTANPAVAGTVVTPCGGPNYVPVTFTTGFNAATNKIALDLGSLFGGLDFSTSKTWMSGRVAGMMTASPSYYYGKYQLDITTGMPINGGIAASTTSPLFVIK
jgi:uncharacterized repeat protein (TIGR04052 family)